MSETRTVTIRDMQDISYYVLCAVDDYCREKGIRYMLSGGSCLGAIRHKGFIPWDDDVDIMMDRADFDRFLRGFKAEHGDRFGVGSIQIEPTWTMPHARIWDLRTELGSTRMKEFRTGIFIDVFPIDKLPSGRLARKLLYKRVHCLNCLRRSAIRTDFGKDEKFQKLKKWIIDPITRCIGYRFFLEHMDAAASAYSGTNAKLAAAIMADHYGEKETIAIGHFAETVDVPFRDRMLPIPKGYDTYLRNLYGDYMKPPKNAESLMDTHLDHWTIRFKTDA